MFDVFLSYNSENRAVVGELAVLLERRNVRLWYDDRQMQAGDNILDAMQSGMKQCRCCAIVIGPNGLGRFQSQEVWQAINQRFQSEPQREFRVIPVLLPGTEELPDLPGFLNYYSYVQFRAGVDEEEPLQRLVNAIRGRELADMSLSFRRDSAAGDYEVTLRFDGEERAKERVNLELSSNPTVQRALEQARRGGADGDSLALVGVELWGRLVRGAIRRELRSLSEASSRHLRLKLPPELEWLPWECLFDEERREYLASDEQYAVIRDVEGDRPSNGGRTRNADAVRLLIGAPEGGQVAYAAEARQISDVLRGKLGETVSIHNPAGPVTLEQLDDLLRDCDIFHYVGHGRIGPSGEPELLFNESERGGEKWVDVPTFGALFNNRPVRLVVLNCCFSGAAAATAASRGGIGSTLLRRGIAAIVTMQFEIKDHIARAFAEQFYELLFSNPMVGRVDHALQRTRRRLRYRFSSEEPRAFLTPQLYLQPRAERLFDVSRPYVRPAAKAARRGAVERLPDDLVESVMKRRCVPIVGPGVLNAGSVRRGDSGGDTGSSVPGPRELAQALEKRLQHRFPLPMRAEEVGLYKQLGDWVEIVELQRICQYYESCLNRAKLIDEISEIYGAAGGPSNVLLHIASWPAPAFICTYIDGALETALLDKKPALSVLTAIDREHEGPEGTLLVHLRGTWRSPVDLVLTEREDHELLWSRFGRASRRVTSILTGQVGRSPLYIGCSPRDMLVQRLSFLLMPDHNKNMGDIFFVCNEVNPIDKLYWQSFPARVVWIQCEVQAAVEELTARLGKAS